MFTVTSDRNDHEHLAEEETTRETIHIMKQAALGSHDVKNEKDNPTPKHYYPPTNNEQK